MTFRIRTSAAWKHYDNQLECILTVQWVKSNYTVNEKITQLSKIMWWIVKHVFTTGECQNSMAMTAPWNISVDISYLWHPWQYINNTFTPMIKPHLYIRKHYTCMINTIHNLSENIKKLFLTHCCIWMLEEPTFCNLHFLIPLVKIKIYFVNFVYPNSLT
jgi:hypothetical protein